MAAADDFRPDPNLQTLATKSADLCVKFIEHKFGKNADYSEAFVPEVENIMQLFHLSVRSQRLSEEDIESFSNMFGSYLGETYRRNRGGEWGVSNENTPSLSFGGGFQSFPWSRAYNRLVNGKEDNVHHWYLGMIQYASRSPETSSAPPPLPKKKGFLSRLFGG